MQKMKPFLITTIFIPVLLLYQQSFAFSERITLFPMDHYEQSLNKWVKPSQNDDQPLISHEAQTQRLELFRQHYYGNLSPWDSVYVKKILANPAPDNLFTMESETFKNFSNQGKPPNGIGYGENFRPYEETWIESIKSKVDMAALPSLTYHPENRAIAVDNLYARALPTDDPHFFSHQLAGQGYPFDNLQVSSIWAGTPLYVFSETSDKEWALVLSPDVIGWVKMKEVAFCNPSFIHRWQTVANVKLAAITKTKTPIEVNHAHLFTAYVGSVFPAMGTNRHLKLMIPVKQSDGTAQIEYSDLNSGDAAFMPLPFTVNHLRQILGTLIGRNYGWGGIYFYNDCSQELKSLFTPFGIWLPRHSSEQITQGKVSDLSALSSQARLNYLLQHTHAFTSIVYIGGHIFLYLGQYVDPNNGQMEALSYQNIWGLRPIDNSKRAVIGKSVLFPLLLNYPEDVNLRSPLAAPYFKIASLESMPDQKNSDSLQHLFGKPT